MYPVICKIGPFSIYSYGLMLALAFLVGSILACFQAKRENAKLLATVNTYGKKSQTINPDMIFNLSFIVFISGIMGARILYIIENITYYVKNPVEIIMLQHGGLSWFGGLMFAAIFAIVYLKRKNLSVYKIFDLVIPSVCLGQAIGRIGCLLNGCCFGKISGVGLYFTVHKAVLMPTQLYSSLILIIIFIILRILQDSPHREGEIFFAYLLFYSLKRFFIEFWRVDNQVIFRGLTLFQIISIIIFCTAITKLILIRSLGCNKG